MKSTQKIELDQVFQAINAGVIVIDSHEVICYCNPVAASFIRLDMKDILGKKIIEVIPNTKLNRVVRDGVANSDQLFIGEQMLITIRCMKVRTEIIVAGGMESMSMAPYVLEKARTGYRLGNGTMIDTILQDGLMDAFDEIHMGITAENIAEQFVISRAEQDAYALLSQNRAEAAIKAGVFDDEIVAK